MINVSIPTNVVIIVSCIILLLIIGIIVYIIVKDKHSEEEEINDLIHDIVNAKPREERKIETKKVEERPIRVTQVSPKSQLNLEEMLGQMQSDLDKRHNVISEYEKDQDENAIISIKELENHVDNNIEEYEKEQEKESIISVKELNLSPFDKLEQEEHELKKPLRKAISRVEEEPKKFKNTDFISPIFGKMDNKIEYPKIKAFNKTADLSVNEYFGEDIETRYNEEVKTDSLTNEMEKNIEFLNALKEFRNNL